MRIGKSFFDDTNREALIDLIKENGWEAHFNGLESMSFLDIKAILVEKGLITHLETEVWDDQDADYSDLHPDETMEEFYDHEDDCRD